MDKALAGASGIDVQSMLNTGIELSMAYLPKVVLALLTLIIGLWLIKLFVKFLRKGLLQKQVDVSFGKFIVSLMQVIFKAILFIAVISMLGVQTTSFIAILGAAGLAVGFALQGSLSNFAGGALIMLFRPFKVGDFIEAQGFAGSIKEIQIFNTILTTPDNKTIIVPNGQLSNGNIVNYSTQELRRVDFLFGIGYADDFEKAKKLIFEIIEKDERILKEPVPMVRVSELADSSVNLVVRVWCNGADYWNIHFDMIENVKHSFDKNGISIPFPQRDVHLYQHNVNT